MAKVEILLGNDGSIKSEAFDFKGDDCLKATEFLNELYDDPEEVELKDEFHLKAEARGLVTNGYCG